MIKKDDIVKIDYEIRGVNNLIVTVKNDIMKKFEKSWEKWWQYQRLYGGGL